MLSDALGQWTNLGEASPARLGAGAPAPAAPELDLPPLPEMTEALTQLHTVAALHADQVEATMRRLDTMCEESARQRKQMSTTAHQAAFGGCARRCSRSAPAHPRGEADPSRILLRTRVAGTSMSTSPACSSAASSPHECATRTCLARAARLAIRGRTGDGMGWIGKAGERERGADNRTEGCVVMRERRTNRLVSHVSCVCSRSIVPCKYMRVEESIFNSLKTKGRYGLTAN